MKENKRKCFKCGSSPADDPETTLFRFPKPGSTNSLRCELWAKYCCLDKQWFNIDFQFKLYTEHRMLCHRHFKETAFVDFPSKKLRRFASPDMETGALLTDQNLIFECPEYVDIEVSKMKLPLRETYQDINSDTTLPPLDKTIVRHYLGYTMKKLNIAILLYKSRHLVMAKSSVVGDYTYIKGYCWKWMKNLQYEVDIQLNKNGNPEASHCECPAGSGTRAVCRHVGVLLLGVENMVREKYILLDEVCTKKMQQFNVPKKSFSGNPMRAEELNSRSNINFDPCPLKLINKIDYNSWFRNLVINFPNSTMPIKQLYGPANLHALRNDHNYTAVSPDQESQQTPSNTR